MRVLVLSWEWPPVLYGGLGRHVHALAHALTRAGHEVVVVTQHADDAPYEEVVDGVRVVRVPEDPPLVPRADLLTWVLALNHALARAALRVGAELRPDVVHAHDWVVAHAGAAVRDGLGVPLVATIHATEAGRHQGWLPGSDNRAIHSIEWWLTSAARRVIACSSHMRWEITQLFGVPGDVVDVVPNGLDPAAWQVDPARVQAARAEYAPEPGSPLVVFTGRLEYEKGVHHLLAAVPRLRARHPAVHVAVAGRGTYSTELRDLAAHLRLGWEVRFPGYLDECSLRALAAAADVAVVPSIYEPFGMVALEAAAMGTALVVAETGGLREVVSHGETGLLFPPGDVAALADAVGRLLDDPGLRARLVAAAREKVQRDHAWSTVAAATAAVYERAAAEERRWGPHASAVGSERRRRLVLREGNLLAGRAVRLGP